MKLPSLKLAVLGLAAVLVVVCIGALASTIIYWSEPSRTLSLLIVILTALILALLGFILWFPVLTYEATRMQRVPIDKGMLLRLVALTTLRSDRSQRIRKAPGHKLISLVDFLYSPKDVEHTFKPIIGDWQTEYFQALSAGRIWKSRWINIRYRYRFAQAMGLSKAWTLVDKVVRMISSAFSK